MSGPAVLLIEGYLLSSVLLVFFAGVLVGGINSLAAGASAISFPILVALGVPPVSASITNSLGVSTANSFALIPHREKLRKFWGEYKFLALLSSAGALIGVTLLLVFPEKSFMKVVPFLLLFATLSLLIPNTQKNISPLSESRIARTERILIFISGIYCGYFGPGQGTMIVAILIRKRDPKTVNIAKNLIISLTSVLTSLIYIFSGDVRWGYCLALIFGSSLGGFLGGKAHNKVSTQFLKQLVIGVGFLSSLWLFKRYYL